MGVKDDVISIRKELEEVKNQRQKENSRVQELIKIKKANRKLQEILLISIFAFIFILIYVIIIKCWQMWSVLI